MKIITYTKYFFLSMTFLSSFLSAQAKIEDWKINIAFENMGTLAFNDRWYITNEGFHIHPASESYTPGLKLGIEKKIYEPINLELQILYARPTAYLGIIDQNSNREVHAQEGFNFVSVLLSVNINLVNWESGDFYISPTAGYGKLSEKSIVGSFGPKYDFGGNSRFIYGVKTGLHFGWFENKNLSFRTELMFLTMKLKIREPISGKELFKLFGPIGLSVGLSYLL